MHARVTHLLTLLAALAVCHSAVAQKRPGEVIAVESAVLRLLDEAEVPAQESGVVTSLKVREGSQVERGQLMAQIDDRMVRLAEREAQVQLKAAREKAANDIDLRYAIKANEVAQAELKRSTDSVKTYPKSVSQSQIDVERLNVEKTDLERKRAEHDAVLAGMEVELQENALRGAQVERALRRITAPFDGTVVEVFARKGEWVQPGEKVLRLVSVDRLKAEGFVYAKNIHDSLVGAEVAVVPAERDPTTQASPSRGKVVFVSPEMDPITGQVRVWAEIENANGQLRPGQPVSMSISLSSQNASLSRTERSNSAD